MEKATHPQPWRSWLTFAGLELHQPRNQQRIWTIEIGPLIENFRIRLKYSSKSKLEDILEVGLTPVSNQRLATVKAGTILKTDNNFLDRLPSFSMKILVWNCKGTANNGFRNYFRQLVHDHSPSVVALCETKVPFEAMGNYFAVLGYTGNILSDPNGFAGGIWLLWKTEEVDIQYVAANSQVIHALVKPRKYSYWLFSAVYGNPHNRYALWESLSAVSENLQFPWLVAGDFNDYASPSEKRSTTERMEYGRCKCFKDNLDRCSLLDLGASGPALTWDNGRKGLANTQVRLDRATATPEWRSLFPEATVSNLLRIHSDHCPLLINMEGTYKMNTDGATKGAPGPSGFGGVLRNNKGGWELGFKGFMGVNTSFAAELQGIYRGLLIIEKHQLKGTILESDCTQVLHVLDDGDLENHLHRDTIVDCIELIRKNEVILKHTFREGNKVADIMANWGIEDEKDYEEIDALSYDETNSPATKLQEALMEDLKGIAFERLEP